MSLRKISNTNCCVYGCHSRRTANPSLSFHMFPKPKCGTVEIRNKLGVLETVDRHKAWEIKLLMGKPVTATMLVCSRHFLKEDYYLPEIPACKPRLRRSVVPTQNLPKKKCYLEKSKEQKSRRYQRLLSRRLQCEDIPPCSTPSAVTLATCTDNQQEEENLNEEGAKWNEEDQDAAQVLLSLANMQSSSPQDQTEKEFADKETQVKSGNIFVPFTTNIDTDAKLSSLTGIPNFKIFNVIYTLCSKFSEEKRQRKLSLKERIIMTFARLKTGFSFVVLSIVFNAVTPNTCKIIFHETICLLAKVLRPLIRWPTLAECQNNLPKCFEKFPNVRVVLDCTEIPLATTKCLCCRLKMYSHYKGGQTIKFMTGVSPAGTITFISLAYGGRASDKTIFEQSGIIKKLTMCDDAIMVDKGFRINDICNSYAVKIIQPPFLYKPKKQFTKDEALLNVSIARARVHIERCNQRIKVFGIFNKPLPWSFLPIINEICSVIYAVVNLSPPILADDKFIL